MTSSPLSAEISRLERLSSPSGARPPASRERYNAFMALARLHRLSGNPEAALKAYEGVLALFPADGRALLEHGRLLVSLGEYDKAAGAAAALLNQDGESLLLGRYLFAQIEAFRSGSTRLLEALANDSHFAEYRSGIYYTLWLLGDDPSWKTRLISEFPRSPEAKIANGLAAGAVNAAASNPSPLWLLWPGRESIRLSPSTPAAPSQTTPSQTTPSTTPAPVGTPPESAPLLQTGLFSREENALALADRLRKAGFESRIQKRQVNGSDHWAVTVPAGRDQSGMMKKLKDAGFDSFPVR